MRLSKLLDFRLKIAVANILISARRVAGVSRSEALWKNERRKPPRLIKADRSPKP
jgi:hypothetical protein